MLRLVHHDRYLMRAERAFDLISVYILWACPSLRGTEHDHWPFRSCRIIIFSCVFLDLLDLIHNLIQCICHFPVHLHRIVALYKIWFPATSVKEMLQFLMRNTRKNRRIADLISIQMQDRKYRSIRLRI